MGQQNKNLHMSIIGSEKMLLMFQNIFCLILIQIVTGFNAPWMFMGRPLSGFRQYNIPNDVKNQLDALPQSKPSWFEQRIDHFSLINKATFQQRYWYNGNFSKPNGPQFLILGGEAPAIPYDVLYDLFPHVLYAKAFNASLWTLEHRFYGESQPFLSSNTSQLEYLNTRQALADIASFILAQNKNMNLTDPKWIIFGGAYAGNLALWFRQLYPNLCAGAVGSSAAVQPKLDFYEYLKSSESIIKTIDPICWQNMKTSFDALLYTFNYTMGRHFLTNAFAVNRELSDKDFVQQGVAYFYSTILSYFQASIQYNNINTGPESSKYNGISLICRKMAEPQGQFNIYKNVPNFVYSFKKSIEWSIVTDGYYENLVNYLKITSFDDPLQASTRAWTWQACNEFGYFPSTNFVSVFSNKVWVFFYTNLCNDVFGPNFNIFTIENGISKTFLTYGGKYNYKGTNVIASRGSIDPWNNLALEKVEDSSVITYLINGTSHCADMVPIAATDSAAIEEFRKTVLTTIEKWLKV